MPRAQPEPNTKPRGQAGDYEEIQVPNKILDKVGPGVGANAAALERAEGVVQSMKEAYEQRVEQEIQNLVTVYENMQAVGTYDLDLLHDRAHEIRGEAGTFGYNLVSDIGKLLCQLLSPLEEVDADDEQAIRAHLNAMQTVVSQKIKGSGPEVAQQVVEGLNAIVEKSRS